MWGKFVLLKGCVIKDRVDVQKGLPGAPRGCITLLHNQTTFVFIFVLGHVARAQFREATLQVSSVAPPRPLFPGQPSERYLPAFLAELAKKKAVQSADRVH